MISVHSLEWIRTGDPGIISHRRVPRVPDGEGALLSWLRGRTGVANWMHSREGARTAALVQPFLDFTCGSNAPSRARGVAWRQAAPNQIGPSTRQSRAPAPQI